MTFPKGWNRHVRGEETLRWQSLKASLQPKPGDPKIIWATSPASYAQLMLSRAARSSRRKACSF